MICVLSYFLFGFTATGFNELYPLWASTLEIYGMHFTLIVISDVKIFVETASKLDWELVVYKFFFESGKFLWLK